MLKQLKAAFETQFGQPARYVFFCPGRANLIGEHIDYNGGLVMPFGIEAGIWLLVSDNHTGMLNLRSHSFNAQYTATYDALPRGGDSWFHFPLGIFYLLRQQGLSISGGLNMYYGSNLPMGAGLSSSAAVEVVTAFALNHIYRLGLSLTDMALLARRAENEYMGMPCGIMDQYAVAHARPGEVLLLNCNTVTHQYLPFDTGAYELLVINTNKPRQLIHSRYAERYAECGEALRRLQTGLPVQQLCQISLHDFERHRHLLGDALLEKRVLHVTSEQFRVQETANALQRGRIETVGRLLSASHRSLRDFYEVTGAELDAVYDFCSGFDGCAGARMTGAGFGGSAIALVQRDQVIPFENRLTAAYQGRMGYPCTVLQAGAAAGVRLLQG